MEDSIINAETNNKEKRWYLLRVKTNREIEFITEAWKYAKKNKLDNLLFEFKSINNGKNLKGYVICNCLLDAKLYHFFRKIPNFIKFVGKNTKEKGKLPNHISDKTLKSFLEIKSIEETEKSKKYKNCSKTEVYLGDLVKLVGGIFDGQEGRIAQIDKKKDKYKIVLEKTGWELTDVPSSNCEKVFQ